MHAFTYIKHCLHRSSIRNCYLSQEPEREQEIVLRLKSQRPQVYFHTSILFKAFYNICIDIET